MFTAKGLEIKRTLLDGEVNMTLNAQISKNLGISLFTDEEIEDGEHNDVYLTMVHSENGSNHDFHFLGIDKEGNMMGVDTEGTHFEKGALNVSNILLRCKIEIIEMLENVTS